jgi:hypothetical protein
VASNGATWHNIDIEPLLPGSPSATMPSITETIVTVKGPKKELKYENVLTEEETNSE